MPTGDRAIRFPVNLGIVVGMQVDIPRGHDLPRGIEDFGAIASVEPADFRDFAVFDPDVGFIAGDAGSRLQSFRLL